MTDDTAPSAGTAPAESTTVQDPADRTVEFDLEDLSHVIEARATLAESRGVAALERGESEDSEAITLQIEIEEDLDVCEPDVEVVDSLLGASKPAFRSEQGLYLRHRVAVLGVGGSVQRVYHDLRRELDGLRHDLIGAPLAVDARYDVALFGGDFRGERVSQGDAELLGDKLATYRANCLVVVNAGAVKARFADRTPQQLALLTRCINRGALVYAQRPYALVFVVDEPIPQRAFNLYVRACQQLGTPAAMMQIAPGSIEELKAYVRFELTRYAAHYLSARRRAGVEVVEERKQAPAASDNDSLRTMELDDSDVEIE